MRILFYKKYNHQIERFNDEDTIFLDKRPLKKFRDIEPYQERVKNKKSCQKRLSANYHYYNLV
jgi:hypothetical protein